MIHKSHGDISQTKGHHCEFVMTVSGSKCGFGDVYRVISKLIVSRPQFKLGKGFFSS